MAVGVDETRLARLERAFAILNGDVPKVAGQAALRRAELEAVRVLVAGLRTGAEAVQGRITDLVTQIGGLGAEVSEAQQAVADLQEALADAGTELGTINANLASLDARLDTAEDSLTALQASDTAQDARLDDAEEAITDLQVDLGALDTELAGIRTDAGAVTVPALTSAPAAAAPTKAEFDKVVADLAAMRGALLALKAAVD